jgi:hypothetical protein
VRCDDGDRAAGSCDDPATKALRQLGEQLDRTIADLGTARDRVTQLLGLRESGHSWYGIVAEEARPLIVETISRALDDLGSVGGRFRREEALALRRENVSVSTISRLFGVTRQRVSALVQERPGAGTGPD